VFSNPFPGTFQDLYAVGGDDDDLAENVQYQLGQVSDQFPPQYQPWTVETKGEAQNVYFLFDKANVVSMFKTAPTFFWNFSVQWQGNIEAPMLESLLAPAETPRKTGWKDSSGVKRAPPPSEIAGYDLFKTLYVSLDVVSPLVNLIAALRKAGRERDANIVQYQLGLLLTQKTTYTDLIAVLEKNGIFRP